VFERNPIGIIATIAAIILLTSSSSFLHMTITGAAGSSNLNLFHNQTLYTSHFYFIPPSSNSKGLHNRALSNSPTSRSNISSVVTNKVIMLGFDDGWKSQITYAKPILDKYGFKASFFIVCNYLNSGEIDV